MIMITTSIGDALDYVNPDVEKARLPTLTARVRTTLFEVEASYNEEVPLF